MVAAHLQTKLQPFPSRSIGTYRTGVVSPRASSDRRPSGGSRGKGRAGVRCGAGGISQMPSARQPIRVASPRSHRRGRWRAHPPYRCRGRYRDPDASRHRRRGPSPAPWHARVVARRAAAKEAAVRLRGSDPSGEAAVPGKPLGIPRLEVLAKPAKYLEVHRDRDARKSGIARKDVRSRPPARRSRRRRAASRRVRGSR